MSVCVSDGAGERERERERLWVVTRAIQEAGGWWGEGQQTFGDWVNLRALLCTDDSIDLLKIT